MRYLHSAFACLIILALLIVQLPVGAADLFTTTITRLGAAPVVGTIPSTAQLLAHRQQLLAAAKTLHLTSGEYDALQAELTDPKVLQYGLIPRHLDAMTGAAPGGGYEALRDVIIPRNQYGWRLTFSHGRHRTDIYIPNKCGNVSYVRRTVAIVKPSHHHLATPVPVPPTEAPLPPPTAAPPTAAPVLPTPGPNKKFFARYWPELAGLILICAAQVRVGSLRLCSFGGHGGHTHHQPTPTPLPTITGHPGPPPPTPTPTPHTTPTPHPTMTPPPTPTPHPTMTPPPTPTPHPTMTPPPTPTPHPTMTPPPTPTPRPTCTPKPTPTPRPTCTPMRSPTPMPSWSPRPTASPSPMPSWSPSQQQSHKRKVHSQQRSRQQHLHVQVTQSQQLPPSQPVEHRQLQQRLLEQLPKPAPQPQQQPQDQPKSFSIGDVLQHFVNQLWQIHQNHTITVQIK